MTLRGIARAVALTIGLVLVLVVVAVGASAALDAPSRSTTTVTEVDAPREEVWSIVMDFASYPEWNPYITRVRGTAAPGRTLKVTLDPPGHAASELDAEVFTLNPPRKFRWQCRLLVPGLRDLEYEVIVAPLGADRTQVLQRVRHEGLLVLFADSGSAEEGLEQLAAALRRRAERQS